MREERYGHQPPRRQFVSLRLRTRLRRIASLEWTTRNLPFLMSSILDRDLILLAERVDNALRDFSPTERSWIVPSAIRLPVTPLSYSYTRSVFSTEERRQQTIETLKSVASHHANSPILLIDPTLASHELYDVAQCVGNAVPVFVADIPTFVRVTESPFKGLAEAICVWGVCLSQHTQESGFWKITGRYSLLSGGYAASVASPNGVTAVFVEGGFNTVCYSVAPSSVLHFGSSLSRLRFRLAVGSALELELSRLLVDEPDLHVVEQMGVYGRVAVSGDFFSI